VAAAPATPEDTDRHDDNPVEQREDDERLDFGGAMRDALPASPQAAWHVEEYITG
jgi:hypothetical protein